MASVTLVSKSLSFQIRIHRAHHIYSWWLDLQILVRHYILWQKITFGEYTPRFDFSRVHVTFSGLLVFTFGFSWWFFSGLKKRSWKYIENFWSKIDFENRSKINFRRKSKILKILIFRKFSIEIQLFRNFRKSWISIDFFRKIEKSKKSKNRDFPKFFDQISKSIFTQKISIFCHEFFF